MWLQIIEKIIQSNKLKNGLLSNIDTFIDYTLKCKEIVN